MSALFPSRVLWQDFGSGPMFHANDDLMRGERVEMSLDPTVSTPDDDIEQEYLCDDTDESGAPDAT